MRIVMLVVIFLVFSMAAAICSTCLHADTLFTTGMGLPSVEQALLDSINVSRLANGLGTLSLNPELTLAASKHSEEMARLGYVDHISPVAEYATPMKRYLAEIGYSPAFARLGENIYYSRRLDPVRIHAAFMRSDYHRENILYPEATEAGIGVYTSSDGRVWVTEMVLAQAR